MSHKAVRAMLEARLISRADQLDLRVAKENVSFAGSGKSYLRMTLLPATTPNDSLDGLHKIVSGIFQIDIFTAQNKGPGDAETIFEHLDTLFPNNLRLTDTNGVTVQIITPLNRGPGAQSSSNYFLPASFRYRCDRF